jgi:hypothetical protein
MMTKPKNPIFEPLCSVALAISGHNQAKIPKFYIYGMMVLYRSEIALWIWPIGRLKNPSFEVLPSIAPIKLAYYCDFL